MSAGNGRPITHCRRLRERASLSQIQLAVSAGVSLNTIKKLELASHPEDMNHMTIGSVVKVSEALGVRVWQLYSALG